MIATALLVLAGCLPLAAPQCFHLDGSQVTEPDFVPCSSAAGSVSMCCGLNRSQRASTRPGGQPQAADVCLPNGLCQSVALDTQGNQRVQFVRESCSRPDWVGCLKSVCPRVTSGNIAMTPCATTNQTTQWCCGDNNVACCAVWPNHPDAASIPLAFANGVSSPRPSGSVVPTAAPTTFSTAVSSNAAGFSVFATANPSSPTDSSGFSGASTQDPAAAATDLGQQAQGGNGELVQTNAGGLSSQAIAGIAAGVVVVVVVLVTIGCFTAESLYKKRNRIFRADRRGSLKGKIRLDRESPDRRGQFGM